MLEVATPSALTDAERTRVWSAVNATITGAVPSPFYPLLTKRSMIPLVIALAVLLGAGGTVAASDDARPGDFLFPVDRAVEEVRLAFSAEKDKADLRVKFAEERVREFDSLVDENAGDTELSGELTAASAKIFTNETIVKLESDDQKIYFKTDADTRAEIIADIVEFYGVAEADVDALLVVETEDRASRAEDGSPREVRIERAIEVLNDTAERLRAQGTTDAGLVNALLHLETRLDARTDIRVKDDKTRIEVRDGDERTRIEVRKDGEVRIKTEDKSDDDSSHDSDDDSDKSSDDSDRSSDDGDDSSSKLEIEADVFTDTTIVKVEQNDRKSSFSTSATTRAEIILAIIARYPLLTSAEIDAVLELEVEDRASRSDD